MGRGRWTSYVCGFEKLQMVLEIMEELSKGHFSERPDSNKGLQEKVFDGGGSVVA